MPRLGTAEVVYKSVGLTQLRSDIKDSESAFKMGATAAAAYAVAIAASIVKIGMPFEQMILNTGAAMRATEAEFKKLEEAARLAGATTEHTATQAAESLLYLGKAGLSAGQAIQALPGMMNFKTAIGSLMSLGRATDVITDSMTAMGLTVKDLAHLTDLFIAASNRSSTDAAKLGESFTKVAGIARLYGTSVEDLTALLAIQASAGLKAELAGTQLKNAFIRTSRAAAELGIENKGLIPTLQAVAKANWDADKIASVYGRIALPSVVAILQKIDGSGPGSLSYFREELSHASDGMGETAIQAEKMRSSVENQFKIVISQVEDLALSIFDRWKPAMLEGIKYMQDFLKSNREMLIGLTEGLKPALEILGVGGALVLGLKAVAFITPVLATSFSTLSAAVVTYATTNAGAMTVLNAQLFGVSVSARAATGALGVLGIAAGSLFAAFAGWKIGSYLYDQFEEARLIGLGFVDTLMRGFIEVEHGGRLAWAGLKTGFGVVMGEMLKMFASFVEGAATAFNALGGYDIGGPLQRASMLIKEAARDTGKLTTAFDEAAKARSSAISEHEKIIEAIRLEHGGYTKSAEESRKSANATLADIRKKADASGIFTKAQLEEMVRLSEAEIIASEERRKAQEEFFKKSGMMSREIYQSRLKDLDAEVTRFRLAGADEIQIAKWKSEEINKLNKQYSGQTTKQLAADGKAREKALDAALKAEFGFLDEREKAIGKAYEKTAKEHEAMLKEIAKLESQQIKEFERTLDDSRKAYENFIEDQLGIKELSAESQAEIDREYARIFEDVQAGNVESFDASMTAILDGKELNIEALKGNDALYSAFLREQEAVNKDIRMEFYGQAGQFSQEYYDSEVARINAYTEKLRAAGVDAVSVEREKTEQMRELDIKKLESSDSFFDGLRLSLEKSKGDLRSWADVGKELGDTFQGALSNTFSTAINSMFEPADTSELEAQLKALQSEYDAYAKKIIEVDNAITESGTKTQDAIREANRKTMTSYELFQDDRLRYSETVAEAEKAILDANYSLAVDLFSKAQGIAASLQREVKDETAAAVNEISGQFFGLQTMFDDLSVSMASFGKESQTALAKSSGVFQSIGASAKNFEKDIAKINLAAALGKPEDAKKIASEIIKNYNAIFKAGESSIKDLMGEWDDYYKKVESVNDDIENIHTSTDDKIRELMRNTMDEQELYNDRRLEFDETYAEATRALQDGNFEYAANLYEESIGLAEKLADDSVGTLEENTATAISLMTMASEGATSALSAYNSGMATSMSEVETAIALTSAAIGDVTTTLGGLEASGAGIVSSLEENTGLAIDLMSAAGTGAVDALTLEQQALEKNITDTEIAMGGLSNKISEKSNEINTNWSGLWSGMLETLKQKISEMVAAWAAEKLTNAAMAGAEYIASLAGYEDGVYNFQPGPDTPPTGDGGYLSVLHPGESVLPADITQSLKEATGWEEAKASVLDYFGIKPNEDTGGIFDTAGDYSASGAALYNAWMAFRDGDNTAGSIALANAFKEGLTTYAANAASTGAQATANLAGGLGGAAGAVGSGIGAWQSFQDENYAQGIMQTAQTIQQMAAAYETLTASTVSMTSTASVTAAEQAAASGAGSVASSLGQIIEGAGWGGAIWSLFTMIAGDEHMQSSLASTGATAGALYGASLGTALTGPYGTVIGGAFGAAIGGLVGTVMDVAQGPSARFEVDDLNDPINAARTWTSDGWAGTVGAVEGDTGSAHGNARNAYLQATQASMDLATATISAATEFLGPELGDKFQSVFAANIDPAQAAKLHWQVGTEGMGASTSYALSATYWNDTVEALQKAALAVAPELGGGDIGGGVFVMNPMHDLAAWASQNMVPEDIILDPTGAAQAEQRRLINEAAMAEQEKARIAGEIGGAATGGVVGTPNESGFLDVMTGEGILPLPAMKWAEDIGKMIQAGGLFGGQFPEFDKAVQPNEITVTFPDDVGRSNVMTELYTSDIVTNTTGANERLDRIIERLEMIVGINREIASRPVPQITRDGIVNMVAGPLQEGARSGRMDFMSPQASRAAYLTIQTFGQSTGNGIGY